MCAKLQYNSPVASGSGAAHCLFERRHGELLNIDVEAGDPMAFRTATGRVEAFGHLVSIETLGLNFESVVYFFADERINKNLLGRLGWLDRVRIGLIYPWGLRTFSVLDFEANRIKFSQTFE